VAALEEGVAARRKRLEAPRDEFETAAQYQDRVQQAKELQGQVQKEREGIEKRFGELAEVQAGPLDSRMEQLRSQPFPVSYSVELGRYDADHGWFEVQVRDERHGVFSATLPVDPALARDLRSRKDRLKGEGFLTLADGSGLPRNVVDPVLGTLPLRASSPVGHWKWGGKPGPLVADRSWTRNPARLLNGAAWAPGRVGPALKLSHAGFQYARVDTCAGLPLGHSPRTLMAWINPASLPDPTYNGVVAYGQMAPSQGSLLSVRGDGRLSMAFWWNDAWQTVGPAIPLNAWSHVAMTYDGGTGVKFFINGQLAQATSVSAGTPADTRPGPVRIGSTDDPGRTFDGMIDDVRIYDTALASAEIEAIARDLVACWDMDPGGADTLLDRSVNGNQAKLQHGAILGPGRGGRAALALAGGRQYARVANPVGLPMGNCPRTMMAWVNPSSLPDPYYNGILTYGGYCTGMGSTLSLRNNGQISVAFWCNDAWQTVGPAVPLNTWTHVAMTYDGRTGVNYFINGQLVQTDALSSGVPPNTQPGPVRIGATDDPGRTFQGSIQDVRIYATALSAAQISAVMAGAGS
jgi:hypothetical protein